MNSPTLLLTFLSNVFRRSIGMGCQGCIGLHFGLHSLKIKIFEVTTPGTLIPLRPNLGVLQIGIKSQGYREPVYILEPEYPEDLVPAEDEAPTPLLPPFFLSPWTPPLLPIPLPAPSTSRRADIPKADTPPRKRLLLTTPRPGCEIGESSAACCLLRQPDPYKRPDSRYERRIMTALESLLGLKLLQALEHRVTVLETEARHHEWQRQAADDLVVQHIMRTQSLEAGAHVDTWRRSGSIPRLYVAAMAEAEAKHGYGMATIHWALRELSGLLDGLRKWSLCLALAIAQQLVKSNLRLALYKMMLLHALKKMMTDKYCPRGEIKKIETECGNLKVKASKSKTMQEVIEFTTELMEDKTHAYAERQAERKRKYDDLSKNNQNQQSKRQNTGQAYTAGNSDRKSYAGSKPLCSKCNCHHEAAKQQLTTQPNNNSNNNNRNNTNNNNHNNNNNQQGNGCFECGAQGHFKRNCPRLRNNDRGNQAGNDRAPAKVYVVGNAGANPDNVVAATGTLSIGGLPRMKELSEATERAIIRQRLLKTQFSHWVTPNRYPLPKIDDLIDQLQASSVYSKIERKNNQEHEEHPEDNIGVVMKRDELYAKFSKCEFWIPKVQFLGHVIDSEGIHVDPVKIESIKDWTSPKSPTEFEWGDKQEAAFQQLKQKLCSAPILALPERSEDFIAYCDASKKGLGAVLMQREKWIIRYHTGKANVVADALSRKEREPPLRVRA
ncbi:putative reverse transcriptase domain-containing protein [Tanacetum coccineum]